MKVPRGTSLTMMGTPPNRSWVKVLPVYMKHYERDALACEVKDTVRFPVTADNSKVYPGTFEGLDLDSGRARRDQLATLRARCRFASGIVRAVTVSPELCEGDILWVRGGGAAGKRATSQWTLEVLEVDIGRLQDMSDKDGLREGVALMPRKGENLTPREWFAAGWDDRYGRLAWKANPWVWIARVRRHRCNVDTLIERWGKS